MLSMCPASEDDSVQGPAMGPRKLHLWAVGRCTDGLRTNRYALVTCMLQLLTAVVYVGLSSLPRMASSAIQHDRNLLSQHKAQRSIIRFGGCRGPLPSVSKHKSRSGSSVLELEQQ